ncbi:MAG: bifunctional GNAT family N-acetyltransferase/carbon-nitrogen hydrolase family protein [Saprospiraceae bacterium]|nr:MAG: nitrilase/cyanide hydratase and apolipoprotein N-acyltransferase [Bacteroidetes bacterium OLB9]MCO6464409.1 bifunctional GNAT family N-acetyltransferase/carbon-nitrogen hydrolase family protein [Saprospiraceae bacterium]
MEVKVRLLKEEDYHGLREAMVAAYEGFGSVWRKDSIHKLLNKFPDGQFCVVVDGKVAACALSIIVEYKLYGDNHSYEEITGNYTFDTHDDDGDVLYGIEVFVDPEFRGLRLARRLYDARKELCEKLNLKEIKVGGRLPNYHKYSNDITPKAYIEGVRKKEIFDPVLNFQLSNDFHVVKVLKNYLPGDAASEEYACLLEWNNIYYTRRKKSFSESIIRLGLVQWQMRPFIDVDQFMEQVEYFVDVLSGYHSDFALFPEFFNAPLLAAYNHLDTPEALRALAGHTDEILNRISELAISHNINIITGTLPVVEDDKLYNVAYLLHRNGQRDEYKKIHITPYEVKYHGFSGGETIKVINSDCGKIGMLICYDVEFPELARLLALDGMRILFVPFHTDTQNAYMRVRNCSMARAIENECYVAIAGSVGNLPGVNNMDIQFAQAAVFTPSDFAFPTNAIKAEATPNTEMTLVVDVDLNLLRELHHYGSVQTIKDRRTDLYEVRRLKN